MKFFNLYKITMLLTVLLGVSISMAASDPSPTNGAVDVPADTVLSWTGGEVYYYKIYFGTNPTPSSSEYKGNQSDTTYDPGYLLDYNTTYYWRIDALTASGNVTGTVWSFTTTTGPASAPSPTDGAVNVPIDIVLGWTAPAGTDYHKVYFGTNPTPGPGEYIGDLTETAYNPGTLNYYTTYYWRIDEVNTFGTLATGTVWSFTTLGGASAPSPADKAVNVPIDIILSWTAGGGSLSHDVYFGTDPTPDSGEYQGNQSDTTYDPAGLLNFNTTYYWRIDEVNASGTATGIVWSFTTTIEVASNPSPVNGANYIDLNTVLSWAAGSGAYYHKVYFGTDPTPDASEYIADLTAPNYYPGLLNKYTTYYWRIDEVNSYGTATGTVWHFTTGESLTTNTRWRMDDNTDNAMVMAEFSDHNGTFYSTNSIPQNTNLAHRSGSPEGTGSLFFDGNDYIQVHGYKGIAGTASRTCTAWVRTPAYQQGAIVCWGTSSTYYKWIFRIEAGGALGVGIFGGWIKTTTAPLGDYQWHHVAAVLDNDGDPDASEILLYIDGIEQPTYANPIYIYTGDVQDVMIGAHREDIEGLGVPNMYYVGQLDDVCIYDYALSADEILEIKTWGPSPANKSVKVTPDSNLSWISQPDALSYDVYLGTNPIPEFKGNQTETTYNPESPLDLNTTYYWRIDKVNANGTTTGTVWSFTSLVPPPDPATNPSPTDGAIDVSVNNVLSWTAGAGAMSHDVYFGTTSPGTFQGNQTSTTFDPNRLGGNATYYWRIDEVNDGGTTTGTVWSFTTAVTAPDQASDPSPANSAIGVPVNNTNLSWTAGAGSTSHDVYFGTVAPGIFQGNQTGTTFDPGALENGTTYYWRIDEVNDYGTTTGTVWSFTTRPTTPVGRWKMDDNTTDTYVFDDSTNRYHGTFAGSTNPNTSNHHSPDCSEGSGSLIFDGEYDYIQISDYKGISGTARRTCTAWIKTYAYQQGAIVCWGTSSTREKWIFRIEEGGALGVGIYGGWVRTATAPLGDYTWHHVAAVLDQDGIPNVSEVLLYIDGVQQETNSSPIEIDTGAIQDVMIGAHREDIGGGGNPNMYFQGLMDEVRIYDYALSPEEIYLLQGLNPPPDETNVPVDSDLRWPTEQGALSYDIYFSTNLNAVQLLGDISGDGHVDILDLSILAGQWLENGSADIVDDDIVNMNDFAALATTWGLDTSFKVNQTDMSYDPGTLEYNTTYYWRIDTVNASGTTTGTIRSFTTQPESASSPSPGDAAANVPTSTDLSWTAGSGAMSYDVYFGSTSPGTFQGNQTSTTFELNTLGGDSTYYWRIDEINEGGTAMGTVWSFATVTGVPTSASLLSPANTATGVPINAKLNWMAGAGAASHDVYFGTTSPGTFRGNQTGTTFDPGTLDNETTYYWRIDEVNSYGTTTGTIWSFTTDFLRLKPEEFAIHAWNHFFGFDLEVFKGIYDCGFNLAGFVNPEDLDLVDAAGLKAHIWHEDFYGNKDNIFWTSKEEIDAIAQEYADLVGDHPALFGYFLRDEPPSDPNNDYYPGLAKWVDAFHTADPGKQTYINLKWDFDWDYYVPTVQNDFLSYDLYGMQENNTVSSSYFPSLEKAYLASVNYSLPLWNTVSSMKLEFLAFPSPANLRFQAFTSLAYGVRGISWFVYFPEQPEWDSLTPIDLAGNKTSIWYMLRDVNFQLHRIGQIYITLNNINVFHYPNVPSETSTMPYGSQGISSSHHVDSLSGGDFCVGEFNDPSGHPYIMLVNKSLTETSNFDVTFKQSGTMYWVNSATGQLETLEAGEMYLAPGEGMLITVQ